VVNRPGALWVAGHSGQSVVGLGRTSPAKLWHPLRYKVLSKWRVTRPEQSMALGSRRQILGDHGDRTELQP